VSPISPDAGGFGDTDRRVEVTAAIRDQAREVARGWSGADAEPGWALVAGIFDALAEDDDLLALAAEIPMERLPALLFVATVQRVVADHPDDPLARYYPGPGQRAVDAAFPAALNQFAISRAEELRVWFGNHYQMNEVARCVQTALALGVVQRLAPGRRLALIDVGTGSGLGLGLDCYHVDLGGGRSFGPPDSTVQLTCAVDGTPALPPGPPDIDWRLGIDVAPIDLDDAASRAWLAACTPPTIDAEARLAGAIALTRSAEIVVRAGDGAALLAGAIDEAPAGLLVVVLDSYTAVFLDDTGRAAMRAAVDEAGRDVVWISLDPLVPLGTSADRCVQELPLDPALVARNRAGGVFALLSVAGSVGGTRVARILATAHPSGTRMTWLHH
jgi:hypothetical protein